MIQVEALGADAVSGAECGFPFRLFIYEGAASTAGAYAISNCSVEEALEAAGMLSRRNTLLWSLAVVSDAAVGALNWLSGTDYNRCPQRSGVRWRLRRQMQDRYLRAQVKRGEAAVLPNGLRRIRMFPEWTGGLSLWESFSDHYPYGEGVLPIPRELEQELVEWNRDWEAHGLDAERPVSWSDEGWRLYERLQAALAGYAEVSPEFDDREREGAEPGAGEGGRLGLS